MELMNWIIKPFDKFMIWLGSTVFNTTVFGIKLALDESTISQTILVDAVYDKGFDAGVESITK